MVDYPNSDEYDRKGFELLEEGQYEEAVAVFKEALALYPYNGDIHAGLGHAFLEMGEFVQAARTYRQGLSYSPGDEDMWLGLGICLLKLNRLKDTEACFEKVTDRLGRDPDANLSLAFAYYQAEHPEIAAGYCRRATDLEEDNAEALALLAVCIQETVGVTDEVHECMKRALEIDPERWDWMEYYANLLYEESDRNTAFQYFDRIPLEEMRIPDSFRRLVKLLKKYRRDPQKIRQCKQWEAEAARTESFECFLDSLQEGTYEDDE
jgi:tetratricopeptide (TPR) repeat protein